MDSRYKYGALPSVGVTVLELGSSLLCDLFCFKAHIKVSQVSKALRMEVGNRDCKLI